MTYLYDDNGDLAVTTCARTYFGVGRNDFIERPMKNVSSKRSREEASYLKHHESNVFTIEDRDGCTWREAYWCV